MAAFRWFSAIKINLIECILCGQHILADRFIRNSSYLVKREVLSIFGVSFNPKEVLRNLNIPKFAEI